MAEPTLAMDYEDLILRVAEHIGKAYYGAAGDSAAAIPTDARKLDQCKRIVNAGWRRFYNANALWNWTLPTFSITFDPDAEGDTIVDGEVWRYYMPDGFYGQIVGDLTYAENAGHIEIEQTAESLIRAKYASADVSGYPSLYAIRPLSGDDARRWEIIFWPKPSAADTVTGVCAIYPNKLIELTDRPNCGVQFDEAVLAACIYQAERDTDTEVSQATSDDWARALGNAVLIDRRSAPAKLGDYGGGKVAAGRPYTGVDTYENLDGTIHTL